MERAVSRAMPTGYRRHLMQSPLRTIVQRANEAAMHLKRLTPGQRPPDAGWDYIEVEEMADGTFEVSAVIHFAGSAKFGRQSYSTRQEAEQAGYAWAQSHDAQIVYLVTLGPT